MEESVYVKQDPKNELLQQAMDSYKTNFAKPLPRVAVFAPSKVTILGDHTEYLGGYSLNMTLPMYTLAVGAPNNENIIKVVDINLINGESQKVEFPIPPMLPVKKGQPEWANLIKAAVAHFDGLILEGFNVVIVSDIPRGYGLGSSSSLVVCMYTFLESITKQWTVNLTHKAQICAKAEHNFTGVPEPYADCLAITMGQPEKAFFIDCSKRQTTPVSLNLEKYAFLVSLVSTKSRTAEILEKRKNECQQALSIVGASSLAEVQVAHLKVFKKELAAAEDVTMRIRHVLAEHIRVSKGVAALNEMNYLQLGRLLNQSQISARYDFEISNDELNSFIELTLGVSGVLGTRLTGTGCGSSTITLTRRSSLNEILVLLRKKVDSQTIFITADPCPGAGDISAKLYNLERSEAKVAVGVFTQIEFGVEKYKLNFFEKKIPPTTAAYAPGRVSVLGEHCDTNNGSIIQMAIPMGTTVIGAFNNTDEINIVVEEDIAGKESTKVTFLLPAMAAVESESESWTNLFRSVVRTFHGSVKRGFDCIAVCSLPPVTGLGRITSLIVAFYTFLECLNKDYISSWTCKAKRCFLAQEMVDSSASSVADHLTVITSCDGCLTHVDCWNLEVKCQPFPVKDYVFLLSDSNLERSGPGILFPGHKNECLELQEILGPIRQLTKDKLKSTKIYSGMGNPQFSFHPELMYAFQPMTAFPEASMEGRISKGMLRRGTHIMTEITRVFLGMRAIKIKDMQAFGLLMLQSHNSLVENYEITEWNQKQLVALAMAQNGVLGSKMTGPAASSCTLTLLKRANLKDVVSGIRCDYSGHVMIYEIDPKEGCQDVTRILQRELSKRAETVDIFEMELSEDTLETEDLDQLSWPMFDLDNEWQVWEKKKKGLPAEIIEKSQESFKVVEEVLSQESEDEDEEVDEEGRKELDELRKTEIDMKRLETLQKDISDIAGPEEDDISSLSSGQVMKDATDRRT